MAGGERKSRSPPEGVGWASADRMMAERGACCMRYMPPWDAGEMGRVLFGGADILFSKGAGGKTFSVDKVGSGEGLPAVSYGTRELYFFTLKNYSVFF